MSRDQEYYGYGFGMPNIYIILIVILIVLQWFRVWNTGAGAAGAPGLGAEPGLVSNGGLFIITLVILMICGCRKHEPAPVECCQHHQHHHHHHHCC